MPRSFPVPFYTRSELFATDTNQRQFSKTDPNSESTLTRVSTGLALATAETVLAPENTTDTSGAAADRNVPAVGKIRGRGWGINMVNALALSAANSVTVAAGTWSVPVHYSRPGGLGTGDITVTFTVILHRINFTPNPNRAVLEDSQQELGRAASGAVTVGTAEASTTINVSGAEAVFSSGEFLWMEVYAQRTNPTLNDRLDVRTQSATALRVSAAPTYTTQHARALADSPAASDAITRGLVLARSMEDSAGVSDALARVAIFPRALADDAPASDALVRVFTGARALADSPAVTEAVTRQWTGARDLADSASLSDALTRQFTGARSMDDSAPVSNDALTRVAIFNRNLADEIPDVGDDMLRQFTGARALDDSAPSVDTLARIATYSRDLEDSLSEGGGTVIRPVILLVDD